MTDYTIIRAWTVVDGQKVGYQRVFDEINWQCFNAGGGLDEG